MLIFLLLIVGSYSYHDTIPWDDDIDLSVAYKDRERFKSIVKSELSSYSIKIQQINNKRDYDKVYFTWCPPASRYSWTFPFIDIFYHKENSTHVWLNGKPSDCPVLRKDVYPLVLRPFGSIWLHAPREPIAHFESRAMSRIGCYAYGYSHRDEEFVFDDTQEVECSRIGAVYPRVARQCISNKCIEYLILNNEILHAVFITPAYRTFFYAEKNPSYVVNCQKVS